MKTVLLDDQPLSSNDKKTVAKRFGRGRITGLAADRPPHARAGLSPLRRRLDVGLGAVGRACRPADAQELYLQHREGRLRRGLRDARGA